MAQIDKLKTAFRDCSGPYSWRDFETMIGKLGYVEIKTGKTGGSRRRYFHQGTKHLITLHEPHDGVMGPRMVRELREQLLERGMI